MGAGFGPAVLMSGLAWQQCHAARRSSGVRRAVAMPALGKGQERASLLALPRPVPLDEVVGGVGVAGRLPEAGFFGSRLSLKSSQGLGCEWSVGRLAVASLEGGSSSWGLEGRSLPRCLERFWVSG